VAKRNQTHKRRVAAQQEQQQQRQQTIAEKKARRQRLVVFGLALALVAPLAAGLIGVTAGNSGGNGGQAPTATVPSTIPPEPLVLPWVPAALAGAAITGPTPCPAADGSSERTTDFQQAPPVCIDDGSTYEITFGTPTGSFSLPIDSTLDLSAANLAVVLARYQSYEKTPVTPIGTGLLTIGGFGSAGFTIPATPPTGPLEELYPIGSVVALAGPDGTVSGSLTVVIDEQGQSALQATAGHVVVGLIDDMTQIQTILDAPSSEQSVLVDSVTVTETG
jgi:hypothetical protein